MLSRIPALTVLLACVPFLVGCGLFSSVGADSGSDPDGLPPRMEIIQFDDDVPPDLQVVDASSLEEGRSLVVDPEVLVQVRFLYNLQVRLEGLRRIIRDLSSVLDHDGPGEINLDWVAEVHEVTREADEYFRVLTSLQVPESQMERYGVIYLDILDVVQLASYGSDRVLAAAVLVGPSGRSLLNMPVREVDEFNTLVRESGFFLEEAEDRVEDGITGVGRAIGRVSLR